MGKIIILIPLHILAAIAYIGGSTVGGIAWLKQVEFAPTLPSGQTIVFDGETLMIMGTVICLMFESIKSVLTGWASITNHMLSGILCIASFGLLLTHPFFGTKAWLIITLTMFADMLIGVVVTTMAARRDFNVG